MQRWGERSKTNDASKCVVEQAVVSFSSCFFSFPVCANLGQYGPRWAVYNCVTFSEWFVPLVKQCEINPNQKKVFLTFPLEWKPSPGTLCVKAPLTLHYMYMTSTKLSLCLH